MPDKPLWIALVGCDGVGKTTQLDWLAQEFRQAGYPVVHWVHRRPGVLFPAARKGKRESHYGKEPHPAWKSIVKLVVVAADWILGVVLNIVRWKLAGEPVLFDRYVLFDMEVDPLRYRYNGPLWLVSWFRRLLPAPDLTVVLDAPVEVLLARKVEGIRAEEVRRQRESYLALIRNVPRSVVISADADPRHIKQQIALMVGLEPRC